jgi:hypothetical protein
MLRRFGTVLAVALVLSLALGSLAFAGDVEGKIKSVDQAGKVVTLEDGTKLTIPATARVDKNMLKPGANVKASFEEKGADKVVTSIQVMP